MLSKTQSSFYRRLFIANLIDEGINTLPLIMNTINIPRRTAQDTIKALQELHIDCSFNGASKNGHYIINSWGPINPTWVKTNKAYLANSLNYQITN
ncbi:helix-turn-helix domain-containing protein [Pseudoalteromonas sp. MMG010]|uniref:helix-turn-helix domain-containing protein n=1 Tax=Pseudoalteromonas sp. MMG010 TaxID=2822685 RepID=UPI001B39EAA9|nr:helix-turn-helix domain-containing protein [Pseudoalteromonas sp. MMG010]MBQ4833193.1 helix-turn-helix domain-containing protein [Pseudoalteromonas sp. MMG010]